MGEIDESRGLAIASRGRDQGQLPIKTLFKSLTQPRPVQKTGRAGYQKFGTDEGGPYVGQCPEMPLIAMVIPPVRACADRSLVYRTCESRQPIWHRRLLIPDSRRQQDWGHGRRACKRNRPRQAATHKFDETTHNSLPLTAPHIWHTMLT